jgi:hypothetical protein
LDAELVLGVGQMDGSMGVKAVLIDCLVQSRNVHFGLTALVTFVGPTYLKMFVPLKKIQICPCKKLITVEKSFISSWFIRA